MPKILPNLLARPMTPKVDTTGKLMWAYGSNLNKAQMAHRCPAARSLGARWLPNARLVFRSVADVVYDASERCPGGLWRITPEDEIALDAYEGVSGGLYEKQHLLVRWKGKPEKMLIYTMLSDAIAPPGEGYLNVIAQGYRDFGLPLDYLDRAVEASWDDKHITEDVRRRRARPGHGPVAYGVDVDALS